MLQSLDRRTVLQGGLGTLAASVALGGCEPFLDKIKNRPIRKNVATLAANGPEITAFRNAVAAMKALPSSDPRNWTRQAQIHNNFCPHGNWFFLPWHRAYLFYFEAICRELSGDKNFALPYWHWQLQPSIPAAFWGGTSNQLFNGTRVATQASVAAAAFIGADALQGVLDNTDFQLFGSQAAPAPRGSPRVYGALEGTPHNYIHGTFVQGDMGGFMSPLDPIFWCHHGMIDCMWVAWNIRCNNANTNDGAWTQFSFSEFCDAKGVATTTTVAATILMPLLSYRYDDPVIGHGTCPSGAAPSPTTRAEANTKMRNAEDIDRDTLKQFLETGAPSSLPVRERVAVASGLTLTAGRPTVAQAKAATGALAPVLDRRERLLLNIERVQEPPTKDVFLRAFVNLPTADATTPITDPHYAGSFAFFGGDHAGHTSGAAGADPGVGFLVDVSETVRRLRAMNLLADDGAVAVTLVPTPITTAGARPAAPSTLSVGGVSLAFSPVAAAPAPSAPPAK